MTSDRVQVVAHPDTGKPASVLIVEGQTLIASFIDAMLAISGFRVVGIAGSGPEALVLAAETRPALALVDIRLNGPPDGTELACLLRNRLAIPAIFTFGPVDSGNSAARQCGAAARLYREAVLAEPGLQCDRTGIEPPGRAATGG